MGRLKLAPAKVCGIIRTFPHQDHNGEGPADRPWRAGELCLDQAGFTLGRLAPIEEPFGVGGTDGRLRWHILRALDWLEAAASGSIANRGDHFELPSFPGAKASEVSVAYIEDDASFSAWAVIDHESGVVGLTTLADEKSIVLVTAFYSAPERLLLPVHWGNGLRMSPSNELGAWIRLPETPSPRSVAGTQDVVGTL